MAKIRKKCMVFQIKSLFGFSIEIKHERNSILYIQNMNLKVFKIMDKWFMKKNNNNLKDVLYMTLWPVQAREKVSHQKIKKKNV